MQSKGRATRKPYARNGWQVAGAMALACVLAEAAGGAQFGPAEHEPATNPVPQLSLSPEQAAAASEAQDTARPQIVSVWPADGSRDVPADCELRIAFNQPMDPMSFKLNWNSGGFIECGEARYDSNRFEFVFPVRLASGTNHQIFVNSPLLGLTMRAQSRQQFPMEGFHSRDYRQAAFFVWQFRTRAAPAPPPAAAPKAVSLAPASGGSGTLLTFIKVQFDQPMMPPPEGLPWLGSQTNIWKQAGLIPYVTYNPSNYSFRMPVLLPPRSDVRFRVAGHIFQVPRLLTPPGHVRFTLDGFRSAAGVAATPVPVEYRVLEVGASDEELAKAEKNARDEQLLALLRAMKQRRAAIRSLAERVQILQYGRHEGLFAGMDSQSASFQMQLPDRFYGDVSEIMLSCRVFRIGCDGHDWWFHCQPAGSHELVVCPADQMHIRELSFADPFDLLSRSVAQAASEMHLRYAGRTNVAGMAYHLVESWQAEAIGSAVVVGSLRQWWIDARTLLPAELVQFSSDGIWRTRLLYDAINTPVSAAVFAVPRIAGVVAGPPDPLDTNYTQRLVIIRDGADGRMSERWGQKGPKGISSGGLN
jgi:hypothetical protein